MFILHVCDVDFEDIVRDYALSNELLDHKAMLASIPKFFRVGGHIREDAFRALPQVLRDVHDFVCNKYGSIEGYLNEIGFDSSWRAMLKNSLVSDSP